LIQINPDFFHSSYCFQGSESEEMSSNSQETESPLKKTCADCGTSKTPLWRGGPAGPKVI